MVALEREALFSVRNLLKSKGAAALICAKKKSVAKKFLTGQRNLRRAHKCRFRLLSISNSGFTGTRLLDTCKFTSSLSSTIRKFRSSSCTLSELRSVGNDRPMSRDFSNHQFCNDHLNLQTKFKPSILGVLVILGSLNFIGPVSCAKFNMENVKEASGFDSNTSSKEIGTATFSQPEESKHATEDVTDVNQRDTSTNQDSSTASSFLQDKVSPNLNQETKSEQDLDQEICTLETSGGVSELSEESERRQTTDAETTECFQKTENENDSDMHCDNESLGLEILFDEDLHHNDAERWITQSKPKTKQRKREKRKRKLHLDALSDDDDDTDITNASGSKDDGLLPKGKKKPKKIMPNYFLAIRISNPQIHSAIKIVQDSITTHNEKLTPTLIPLPTLHLTLMVIHLENDEQLQKATEVLNQCKISLDPILQNSALTITFSGLDHFNHQVLYVKALRGEEVLKSVVNIIRETFTNEGIPSTDHREFSPHLTVMILSRKPTLRRKGIKKIPGESYASWVDMSFGKETVNALHLCSMNKKKEKDGFYKCEATVTFNDAADDPASAETGNTRGEGDEAQENSIGDVEQEATSSSTALCDENTGEARKTIEENTSCDEGLSNKLDTWTVDDSMEDEVVTKEPSELQGDSEGNSRKSDQ